MSEFRWENPPVIERQRNRGPKSEHVEIARRLKDRPGRWARIMRLDEDGAQKTPLSSRASMQASMIRRGRLAAFKVEDPEDGEFEAVATPDDDGTYVVYARFVHNS